MDLKLPLLLLACIVIVQGTITGLFKYKDHNCVYTEFKIKNSHDRLLGIQCFATKEDAAFRCIYEGDPHDCHWYNKNNQPAYYECLAKKLSKDEESPCRPEEVYCKKHCDEIIFKKQEEAVNRKQESLVFEKPIQYEVEDDVYPF